MDTEKLVKNVLKQVKFGTDWLSNNIEEVLHNKGETLTKRIQEETVEEYENVIDKYKAMWDEPCEFKNSYDRLACLKMDLANWQEAFSLYVEQLNRERKQSLKERQLMGEKISRLTRQLERAYDKINKIEEINKLEEDPCAESGITAADIPPRG